MSLMRTKPVAVDANTGLKRCLTAFDLTLLGIGCIIGTGIFVLTGKTAANVAGPAIILSFVIAGLGCAFAALAYAELASAFGGCGSAYGYSYASMGELIAWIIGWDLILEYGMAASTVAVGWSGYFVQALKLMHIHIPDALTKAPGEGGLVNLPALSIIFALAILLAIGAKQSARFNAIVVLIKLITVFTFIFVAFSHFDPAVHWADFTPFPEAPLGDKKTGILAGAAIIFFAYIGFDAVSTAAEEAVRPQRDVAIGILASLAICTVIYIVVSGLMTGITSYQNLNVSYPMAEALNRIGSDWGLKLVIAGAIAGLTTVMLVLYYGLTRVFLAMSRDGLLPPVFSAIHPKTQTPVRIILFSGLLIGLFAGFIPLNELAELVNIGTLAAFVLVCAGVIVLRRTMPDLHRPFRTPWSPLIPLLGILFCVAMMIALPAATWLRFAAWMGLGLVLYFAYSRSHSVLASKAA